MQLRLCFELDHHRICRLNLLRLQSHCMRLRMRSGGEGEARKLTFKFSQLEPENEDKKPSRGESVTAQ